MSDGLAADRPAADPAAVARHDGTRFNLSGRARRGLWRWARRAAACLREWQRRRRSRALLATFDARMLRDIGVTVGDAEREINKRFWRP